MQLDGPDPLSVFRYGLDRISSTPVQPVYHFYRFLGERPQRAVCLFRRGSQMDSEIRHKSSLPRFKQRVYTTYRNLEVGV